MLCDVMYWYVICSVTQGFVVLCAAIKIYTCNDLWQCHEMSCNVMYCYADDAVPVLRNGIYC